MKTKLIKFAFAGAIAIMAGINAFNAQKKEFLSDIALANVEALAQSETSDEFIKKTCCEAVWEDVSCDGCDGQTHRNAKPVEII